MVYDIIIKSGFVLSGKKEPGIISDVGVDGERISAVGDLTGKNAGMVINAFGKYVAPGFVDITNHSDTHLTLFKYPYLESLLMQGITTAVGGNCGASLAPLGSEKAIRAISKWVDPYDININWTTVSEFLEEMETLRPAVNLGTFIGYGTLRRSVIGDEIRLLNFEEREEVKLLLRRGMTEGALGLSLGLTYGHERVSPTEEIIEIAKVLPEYQGIIKMHLRSEGAEILASVNEAIRLAREVGVSVEISHLKGIGKKSWLSFKKALELISQAQTSGADINFDVSPYRTTGSPLYLLLPGWAREGGFSELMRRIDDASERKKIIEALKLHTLHYDKILITSAKVKNVVGKTLAEVAENAGMPPEEAFLSVIRVSEGRVKIIGRTVSVKNTELAVKNQNSFVSSDGAGYAQEASLEGDLVHPRSFGAFPHFWHKFVFDLKALSPEEAIKKITSGPAGKMGLKGRGTIAPGNFADIIVFDPKIFRDRATYQNPFKYPAGMEWVVINGKVAVDQGRPMGVRAGKVLRRV